MSRALIIKNADFSVNKLGTITFDADVPCTGITISESAITLNSIGGTSTLTAATTPAGTTDAVIWSTSDADVATVAGGTITAVGLGTATITATCGTQSASCAVTVKNAVDYAYDLNAYYAYSDVKTFLEGGDLAKYATIYTTSGNLKASYPYRNASKYPIMIPDGATKMKITCSPYKSRVFWLASTIASASPNVAKCLPPTDTDGYVVGTRTIDIPEKTGTYADLDAFVIGFNIGDGISDEVMQTISVELE